MEKKRLEIEIKKVFARRRYKTERDQIGTQYSVCRFSFREKKNRKNALLEFHEKKTERKKNRKILLQNDKKCH